MAATCTSASPSYTTSGTSCSTRVIACTSHPADSSSYTAIQPAPVPQLNWSHFKPEFAGKPDKDAEAHFLRMNDWMDTHALPEGVKVKSFYLTLVGEASYSMNHLDL